MNSTDYFEAIFLLSIFGAVLFAAWAIWPRYRRKLTQKEINEIMGKAD